jgi:cell division protein FtsZ
MVDTLIIIPNQNLFRLANEKTTFTEAFSMADDVLYQGVKGVTDLMVRPGLINLDFADVRAVMDEMGKAMMGTGEAEGEDRAIQAAEKAIANPLLDEISLKGARGVLINITGGYDLTLFELDEAANRIREEVDPDANIIVGSTLDPNIEGRMRVSVVATGIDANERYQAIPVPRRKISEPLHSPKEVEDKLESEAAQAIASAAAIETGHHYDSYDSDDASEYGEEPQGSFFDEGIDATAAAAEEQAEDIFRAEDAGGDLPPPAYQPQAKQPEYRHQPQPTRPARPEQPAVARFVAPKAPSPGAPSPEALARLQAAVQRTPRREHEQQVVASASDPRAPQEPNKPRFGINSLINRMTGHSSGGDQNQASPRQQPPVRSGYHEDPESDPEHERVEIPAFLRRQAN